MTLSLASKVALITGGGSGIGAATAQLMSELGAHVWIADRDHAAALRTAEGMERSCAVAFDVTDENGWRTAISRLGDSGPLDIMVNAAGISRTPGDASLEKVSLKDWRAVFATNVEGTLLGCQAAISAMGQRGGAIVNVSSTTAISPTNTLAAYGASKAAVLQLTRSVAAACTARGLPIRCNAVQPGMIETPMTAGLTVDMRARWESQIPARRFGLVWEIAQGIAFLASDWSSYINGEGLLIDGGLIHRSVVS